MKEPDWNDSSAGLREQLVGQYNAMVEQLRDLETSIAWGRAMRARIDDPVWKKGVEELQQREKVSIEALLQCDDMRSVYRLQGQVRTLRILQRAPSMTQERLEEMEASLPELQQQLEDLKNVAFDTYRPQR